jgi:succinate dehydrogenase hydrophobic anchor subunit
MFDNMKRNTSFEPWAWYPILFLPLTAIVLVAYVLWIFYYKSKAQKNLDNYSV